MPRSRSARWRTIGIAGAPVRALRVTYVGELGYELHVPSELALTVYDALVDGGRAARPRPRRLSRHRVAAPGEGLPRLGRRHRPRPHAARGGPRLRREAGDAASRSSAARRSSGSAARALSKRLACFTVRPGGRPARPRDHLSRRRAGRLAGLGRLRLHRRARRSAMAMCAMPQASIATGCRRAATSSRSRPSGSPATLHLQPLYDPTPSRIRM